MKSRGQFHSGSKMLKVQERVKNNGLSVLSCG